MPPTRYVTPPPPEGDPFQFELAGTIQGAVPEGEPTEWSEVFTTVMQLPASALNHLVVGATVNDQGAMEWSRLSVMRFLRVALIPEDEPRWDALMIDKRRPVDLEVLGNVMMDVQEAHSDRPTGPRSSSATGPSSSADGSEDA